MQVRPRITREQVFSAADSLATAGITATVDAIREITGGSDKTVNGFLRLWKALNDVPLRKPLSDTEQVSISPERTRLVHQCMDLQEKNQLLVSYAGHLEEQIARLRRGEHPESEIEKECATCRLARFERQIADLHDSIRVHISYATHLEEENTYLRDENEDLKKDLARAMDRNGCLEQESEDYRQRIVNMQSRQETPTGP